MAHVSRERLRTVSFPFDVTETFVSVAFFIPISFPEISVRLSFEFVIVPEETTDSSPMVELKIEAFPKILAPEER